MSTYKVLIDTNIIIALEDPKAIPPEVSALVAKCSQYGVRIFVHEASTNDIARDKNDSRREISLSKLKKFEVLDGIELPSKSELESKFGSITSANDEVDVALLYALDLGAVDFLVTEDNGIHRRAARVGLDGQTFRIPEALNWVIRLFDQISVKLPQVEQKKAHQINKSDEIFDSLRNDYPAFDAWWQKCIQDHRECWVITVEREIAGIIVRKDEKHNEANTLHPGNKILKICTFKVKDNFRGQRFGELLLKQVLWFAQRNGFELVYVTVKPLQSALIQLLEYFGFEQTKLKDDGDYFYEKKISREKLAFSQNDSVIEHDRKNYPRFITEPPVKAFCVPIQAEYHVSLFPEISDRIQMNLFDNLGTEARRPGNTIRKVYICRSRVKELNPGDILLFYKSKSSEYQKTQAVTTIGIIEKVTETKSEVELIRLTALRSVFRTEQLSEMLSAKDTPLRVIEFMLIGHIDPPLSLANLSQLGVLSHPPQSIVGISHERFAVLAPYLNLPFAV